MKILNFQDFMKKCNIKNDTMNEFKNKEFIIILYTPGIVKYNHIKNLLI